jgi:hypothetical protein
MLKRIAIKAGRRNQGFSFPIEKSRVFQSSSGEGFKESSYFCFSVLLTFSLRRSKKAKADFLDFFTGLSKIFNNLSK